MEIRQKVIRILLMFANCEEAFFHHFFRSFLSGKKKTFCCCKMCVCVTFFFCFVRKGKKKRHKDLKYNTPCLLLLFHLQCSSCCCLKHFTYTLLGFSWTFQICKCINFLKHRFAFWRLHRLLLHLCQLFDCVRIISEIFFVAD